MLFLRSRWNYWADFDKKYRQLKSRICIPTFYREIQFPWENKAGETAGDRKCCIFSGLRLLGIGRNEYLELVGKARSLGRRGRYKAIRGLLPKVPLNIPMQPWWRVELGYVLEEDVKVITSNAFVLKFNAQFLELLPKERSYGRRGRHKYIRGLH